MDKGEESKNGKEATKELSDSGILVINKGVNISEGIKVFIANFIESFDE